MEQSKQDAQDASKAQEEQMEEVCAQLDSIQECYELCEEERNKL